MRDRIRAELGSVQFPGFLCYLMGPYATIDRRDAAIDVDGPLGAPSGSAQTTDPESLDAMVSLLRRVQGSLRTDPGVNAFLAVDVGIPLGEVDAATQSVRFARASNAVAFVLPRLGDNLGVGIEVGAVLEDRSLNADRLFVVHEAAVTSAMLEAVTRRWEARIATYETEAELVAVLRRFVAEIMFREASGRLTQKQG